MNGAWWENVHTEVFPRDGRGESSFWLVAHQSGVTSNLIPCVGCFHSLSGFSLDQFNPPAITKGADMRARQIADETRTALQNIDLLNKRETGTRDRQRDPAGQSHFMNDDNN